MKVTKKTVITQDIIKQMDLVVSLSTRDTRDSSKHSIQSIFNTLPLVMDETQYDVINTHRVACVKRINKL